MKTTILPVLGSLRGQDVVDALEYTPQNAVTLAAPSITYTPSPPAILPALVVVPPQGVFSNGQFFTAPGVWLKDFPTNIAGLEHLTFNNVVGIAGDFLYSED